jgi:hypothetical protein
MANASTFTIVITALDKASATMMRINASMGALASPITGIGRSMAKLADVSGLENLGRAVENVGSKFGHLGSQIGGVLGPLAALGAAATAGGLFELAKGATDWGHNLSISAEKTGVAADALAKLHYVASTVNVGADQMDKALFNLNDTISDVAGGRNKVAAEYLRKMGISIYDVNHHLKDAGQLFPALSKAIAANGSITQNTGALVALIGKKMAENLIPVLNMGGERMKVLMGTFEQMYGKITPAVIKAAEAGHESFERLSLATEGLKFTIGSALFPAMEKIITPITAWVAANRKLIATRVGEWAKNIGDALARVDWNSVILAVVDFGSAIWRVFNFLGPFWSTIAVGAVMFSPFIAATLSAGAALVELGLAMGGVAARMGAFLYTEGLSGLALKMGLLTETAVPALSAAFVSLGAAIEATPIGWILTGIAALAALAYVIYENWQPISDFFVGLWHDDIVPAFRWAYDYILPLLPGGTFVKMIVDNWSPLEKWFGDFWKYIVSKFDWGYNKLKSKMDWLKNSIKFIDDYAPWLFAAVPGVGAAIVVSHVVKWAQTTAQHGAAIRAMGNMPSGSGPIGVRLNNPLNMRSWGSTPLVSTRSGNFAHFASPEQGVSAAAAQLQIYNRRGWNTLSSIISHWAPSSENNTGAYIAAISKAMGVAPGAQLNLNNSAVMQSLIAAMARHEQGYAAFTPAQIAAGVNLRMGATAPRIAGTSDSRAVSAPVVSSQPVIDRRYPSAPGTVSAEPGRGKVDVSVTLANLPPGTRTSAKASGDTVGTLDVGRRFSVL